MRRNKYGTAPKENRTADNVTFASKAEMVRYLELKANLNAGIIRDLKLQPRFPIYVAGVKVCEYVADFSYVGVMDRAVHIEDVKGFKTAMYRLKAKLFAACYPDLRIVEL